MVAAAAGELGPHPVLSLLSARREWMVESFSSLKGYWTSLTSPLSDLWPLAPGATPAPAV